MNKAYIILKKSNKIKFVQTFENNINECMLYGYDMEIYFMRYLPIYRFCNEHVNDLLQNFGQSFSLTLKKYRPYSVERR
jgi:hypothetical protein